MGSESSPGSLLSLDEWEALEERWIASSTNETFDEYRGRIERDAEPLTPGEYLKVTSFPGEMIPVRSCLGFGHLMAGGIFLHPEGLIGNSALAQGTRADIENWGPIPGVDVP